MSELNYSTENINDENPSTIFSELTCEITIDNINNNTNIINLTNNLSKTFKILSIDGGGSRVLYSLYVLNEFEKKYCKNGLLLRNYFDMLCGTSIASSICILISKGFSIEEIINIFEDNIEKIFPTGIFNQIYHNIMQIFGSKYNDKILESILHKYVDDDVFNLDTLCNYICVPSFNLVSNNTYVFKNYNNSHQFKTKDVILSTCAAPTYFPSHKLSSGYYIDGAIWSNNPSMVGFYEASNNFIDNKKYNDCAVLSIGNIVSTEKIFPSTSYFWNIFKIPTLINVILDSVDCSINHFMKKIGKITNNVYVRISHKELNSNNSSIDDASIKMLSNLKKHGIEDGLNVINNNNISSKINISQFFNHHIKK